MASPIRPSTCKGSDSKEIQDSMISDMNEEKSSLIFGGRLIMLWSAKEFANFTRMHKSYNALRDYKWLECIDECHRRFGETVYDEGLHGKQIEPGYMNSMRNVFSFLDLRLHWDLTPDLYLKIHAIACAHFKNPGSSSFTHCSADQVGQFRDSHNIIHWNTDWMTETCLAEFTSLDLGEYDSTAKTLNYKVFSSLEIRARLKDFIDQYKEGIKASGTDAKQKLRVIAQLFQRMEWLHPPVDGCGRTDTAILNFLLVQNGFHPVLLGIPYFSSVVGLDRWVEHLDAGLFQWEETKRRLEA